MRKEVKGFQTVTYLKTGKKKNPIYGKKESKQGKSI